MAHYDLYQSLRLDRQASTADLARDLDDRLSSAAPDDAGMIDQLTTARAILGDDTRRGLYDQRLDDPNAAEIDIDSLHELAALNVAGSASAGAGASAAGAAGASGAGRGQQFQQQAGQFARTAGAKTAEATHQVQDSFKQSKGLAIGITALVTAVVVLLGGWGIGKIFGGDGQPDFSDAQKTVNTFLEQKSADDLRSWLNDNTVHQNREDILRAMGADEDAYDSFSGMDSFFDASSLEAGAGMSFEQQAIYFGTDVDEIYEEGEDEGFSRDEVDSMVIIGIKDGSDNYKGEITLVKKDGDYKIIDVTKSYSASDYE